MARVSKDPQIRIAEILDAAEMLFNAKGYHETMVSDIVKQIGIAQGTFYYYFKSKEEVLESIVQRKMFHILKDIESVIDDASADAPTKLSGVINHAIQCFYGKDILPFEYLYNDQYLHMLDKITRQGRKKTEPLLMRIVDEGVQYGYFKLLDSKVAVEFITAVLDSFCAAAYLRPSKEEVERRLSVFKQILGTILGVSTEKTISIWV